MNLMQQSPPSPSNKYGCSECIDFIFYAAFNHGSPLGVAGCLSLVKGGIGQLIKEILKKTFQDTLMSPKQALYSSQRVGNITESGWIQCIVQDGAAHRATFSVKGDSGTRCCLLCKNVSVQRVGWWMKMELHEEL